MHEVISKKMCCTYFFRPSKKPMPAPVACCIRIRWAPCMSVAAASAVSLPNPAGNIDSYLPPHPPTPVSSVTCIKRFYSLFTKFPTRGFQMTRIKLQLPGLHCDCRRKAYLGQVRAIQVVSTTPMTLQVNQNSWRHVLGQFPENLFLQWNID